MEYLVPLIMRGMERIIVTIIACIVTYLGYKLFVKGVGESRAETSIKTDFITFLLKGRAPGLFFMAFGCMILFFPYLRVGLKPKQR